MAVAKRRGRSILIDDSNELHDVDTILELAAHRAGELHRQRGLPHAPRADQRDQPVIDDHLGELLQQHLAADQRLHDGRRSTLPWQQGTIAAPAGPSSISSTVATNS